MCDKRVPKWVWGLSAYVTCAHSGSWATYCSLNSTHRNGFAVPHGSCFQVDVINLELTDSGFIQFASTVTDGTYGAWACRVSC